METKAGDRKCLGVPWAIRVLAVLGGVLCLDVAAFSQELSLSIADMQSPSFSAKSVTATLKGKNLSILDVAIGELTLQGKIWKQVKLTCPAVSAQAHGVSCNKGLLQAGKETFPVSFSYSAAPRQLEIVLKLAPLETWRMVTQFNGPSWQIRVTLLNAGISRLAQWFPDNLPRPSAGTVSGVVSMSGKAKLLLQTDADLRLAHLAFSDPSGLHAGEKVDGTIKIQSVNHDGAWRWRTSMDWQGGEVFWQPLYFSKGGYQLQAQGKLDAQLVSVEQSTLKLGGVGKVDLDGKWVRAGGYASDINLRGNDLDLKALYRDFLKPFLEKTAFSSLDTQGKVDLDWRYRDRATRFLDLKLHHVFAADEKQRFALYDVNAVVPWRSDAPATADIRVKGAQLLNVPLGEMQIPLQMHGLNFSLAALGIPVLDGKLNLTDFQAALKNDAWEWQFSGGLTPVSMERFSQAMSLPLMHGTISGVIPQVTYSKQSLSMDGALLLKVFDGTIVVKGLSMLEPLGLAPRLKADLDMRNLDLGLLTRTFSFGSMDGRIDVMVNDIELSNWKPVQFNASVQSSAGDYRKKISQRAVQNISSLGGAGASAAIQRSLLSVFEEFGYDKIGLSCVLRNGVCLMGGVTDAAQGYVIVKGGGIPAITVIGYNRYVSWDELVDRLQRVTQGNVKAVIQ